MIVYKYWPDWPNTYREYYWYSTLLATGVCYSTLTAVEPHRLMYQCCYCHVNYGYTIGSIDPVRYPEYLCPDCTGEW